MHYDRYNKDYCTVFKIPDPPSITAFRLAGSTVAFRNTPTNEMEHVSHHMGHSITTAERHYRSILHGEQSEAAFDTIKSVYNKPDEPDKPITIQEFANRFTGTPSLKDCCEFVRQMTQDLTGLEVQREGKDKVRNIHKKVSQDPLTCAD